MGIPDDSGHETQDESNQHLEGEIEKFIDLCTDQYIIYDEGSGSNLQHVYVDDMEPWKWLVNQPGGYNGSPAEAKNYYLTHGKGKAGDGQSSGSAIETGDDRIIIVRSGAFSQPDVWYKRKGQAWTQRRAQFEGVKKTFNDAMSYKQGGLSGPILDMENAVKDLIPKADISQGEVDSLSNVNVTANDRSGNDPDDTARKAFDVQDKWDSHTAAADFLSPWQGRGAEVFKFAYLDRMPSILLGQCMTAKVLHQSAAILSEAFTNVRGQSIRKLADATDVMWLYPSHHGSGGGNANWADVLDKVAGIATIAAGAGAAVAVPTAGTGAGFAAVATMIAGGAALTKNIAFSEPFKKEQENEVKLEGDSVTELYNNFHESIRAFIRTVDNTESVLKDNLEEFKVLVDDTSAPGVELITTFGDDVALSQHESFFAPKAPGDGSLNAGPKEGMGAAPKIGAQFSADLNGLFKTGTVLLPELASNYDVISRVDGSAGMAEGTTRTGGSSAPNGAAFQPWMDLYRSFENLMGESSANLKSAGIAITQAAISYREQDAEAATGLDDVYRNLN